MQPGVPTVPAAPDRDATSDGARPVPVREPSVGSGRPPRYGLVLLAIVLSIAVMATGTNTAVARFLALVILAAALLLALRDAQVTPRAQRRAAVIVGLGVVSGLIALITGSVPPAFTQVLTFVLIGATPFVMARRLLETTQVTIQSLIGALSVYLLLGLFFSFVFSLTEALSGTPYFVSLTQATSADFVYFSYVTLATVGYGDLAARTNLGRMLAVTEALTGQLYLVTVVALLVSKFRPRRSIGDE